MDILFTILFSIACIFVGWQLCLLYFTFRYKQLKKMFPVVNTDDHIAGPLETMTANILYNEKISKAINNAKKEMKNKCL